MWMSVSTAILTTVTSPPELHVPIHLVHSPVDASLDFLGMAPQGLAKVQLLTPFFLQEAQGLLRSRGKVVPSIS